MMPLVDPRRPSSHVEPEASRTLLSHRLGKITHCDISRAKTVEITKSHLKKPEKLVKELQQQQKQQQQPQQQQQQQQVEKPLAAKLNHSEETRTSKEEVKEAHPNKGLGLRSACENILGGFAHPGIGNRASANKSGAEVWDSQRLEEESEIALERRRQQLTQELMREIAADTHHHHHSNMDKKSSSNWDDYGRDLREILEPQRKDSQLGTRKRKREERRAHGQHAYRRSLTSSSSSSSSSTSSSTSSSSSSSSTDSSPHRSGHKRDAKRKSRGAGKRMSSTSDRSKMKKMKSSSSSRKHGSSKIVKKGHQSKKDHEKLRSHKSSHSPSRRKSSLSKRLMSPGRKRSPSPGSRKSHKISPGLSKHSKSRKRSGSPRERLDYRGDRIGHPERSLSHGRDPNMGSRAGSSSRNRDPRIDERMRRISPEQIARERYSRADSPTRRYDKERIDEFIEARRDRRSPIPRSREVERKDPHRHREYERHERDHYDERRREDPRREEREREQRERELRELREREIMKERERELLEQQERERERLREEERRGRYGREHEFAREREVVVRGGSRDFEGERDFYSPRGRPELDARVLAVDDRRAYDDPAYDRFQGERERSRYDSGRSRYDELALHDRRGLPPLDDRRADRRGQPLDARFQDDRRRSGGTLDPRVHEPWLEEHRALDRLDRPEHFPPHGPPARHRHQPEWTGGRQATAWDRHKHPRHEDWAEDYVRGGGGGLGARDWVEDPHDWGPDLGGPAPAHQDQWSQHPSYCTESRRGYRDDWGGRASDWVDHGLAYPPSRDLGLPAPQGSLLVRGDHSQPPPMNRRSRREPIEQPLEPPPPSNIPPRHHPPPSVEEESIESALVPPRSGDVGTPPPQEQDQALMPGNDGELWEYDPGKGSWVRRAADAAPSSEAESPAKKEKPTPPATAPPEPTPEAKQPSEPEPVSGDDKKRNQSEENSMDASPPKRQQTETPAATPGEADASLQEKDTFSDISDDADDILNQEVGGFNDEDSRNLSSSQMEDSRNLSRENGPSYDELMDEEETIHLEEISDDELEEDRQAKFSVADALDINWASLVRDSRPPVNEVAAGTALKRFSPAHLLARLGVSTRYARPDVIQSIKEACAANVTDEEEDAAKLEVPAVTEKGGVLRLLKARAEGRQRVLQSIGPNRRALCARQDIALRRQLCNLPEQDYIGDNPLLDRDLFRQSINLLKSC
ncbi:zinc finger CCCH domain-containing protein 13-like isoform X1 [Macrobrachium nipponense]|uniref:zinc finger CCCH domain-containing protein 13-like isoform X1 n=2 Tax=Macrobrachium nipponense TaxID=159736 RepID=UPI0030C85436